MKNLPEKIYVHEISALEIDVKIPYSVEYTRTDAFIKKACDAYCKVCGHYSHTVPAYICRNDCDYFSDFEKYMKGE